jgi:hypothetical protein
MDAYRKNRKNKIDVELECRRGRLTVSILGSSKFYAESARSSEYLACQMNNVASTRETYRRLNESFPERYLHRFGRGVGFSAEFIHVLKAVAQCLDHGIQFCLQSNVRSEGFAVQRGWTDYFEPLFPEVTVPRLTAAMNRAHFPFGRIPLLKSLSRTCLKAACSCRYFVFDEFGSHPPARLSVPALGLGDDYWHNMQALTRLLWTYNAQASQAVAAYRAAGQLRSVYNAVHVRRGDKKDEAGIHHLQVYIDAIRRLNSNTRQIFVATDDSRIIGPLRNALGSDYVVHFNLDCDVGRGYDQIKFNSAPTSFRRERTLRFFADVEVLYLANHFVGASTSNVFNLVQYLRANKNITDVAKL